MKRVFFAVLLFAFCFGSMPLFAEKNEVGIGVLAFRSKDRTLLQWQPTADYLTRAIPQYRFYIVALDYPEIGDAIANQKVDFIITNTGHYVSLETLYGVSRIATLMKSYNDKPITALGSVIFTRADRNDINSLEQIKGHSVAAVSDDSLGGYMAAFGELQTLGITQKKLSKLHFTGMPHDLVVRAVKEGGFDVGIVRTQLLEELAKEGSISMDEFKILGEQKGENFPFVRSTRLYPEWPIAKLQNTSNYLANKVVMALLGMPYGCETAAKGGYYGWTAPLDYQPVHELMKRLHVKPYDETQQFDLRDVVKKYPYQLLAATVILLLVLLGYRNISVLNRKLKAEATQRAEVQQQLREIAYTLGEGIYVIDESGTITFVNPKAQELLGFAQNELIGQNSHLLFHHTKKDGTPYPQEECQITAVVSSGEIYRCEDEVFWRKDGTPLLARVNSSPIIRNGAVTGSVVAFQDVREKKERELMIKALLAEQTALFDSAVVGITLIKDRKFVRSNKMWEKMMGYEPNELDGKDTSVMYKDYQEYEKTGALAYYKMQHDGFYEGEHLFLKKDGNEIAVLSGGAYIDRNDPAKGSVWVAVDITKRKELENALEARVQEELLKRKESEAVYGLLFNHTPIGIVVTDDQCRILNANHAFYQMTGYGAHELADTGIKEITDPEDFVKEQQLLLSLLGAKSDSYKLSKLFIGKHGRKIEAATTASVVRDPNGHVRFIYMIIEDVTQQNEVKRKQSQQEQLLLQQSKMAAMGEMIAAIAHQWRQPLNSLALNVQDVEAAYKFNELDEEYIKKSVASSMDTIRYMSKTIDDFRNFFRPDKQKESFDIATVTKQVLSILSAQLKEHDITVELEQDGEELFAHGYPNEFKQVILNIVNNAKDALLERDVKNPIIKINICTRDEHPTVCISDNAGGISEDIMKHIFDPFFTTKGNENGTGIGLSMAKTIIEENMQGKLSASNTVDGVQFLITL